MAEPSRQPQQLPPHIQHGTLTAYNYYKCGCADCRRWSADYRKSVRTSWHGKPLPPGVQHGTLNASTNYGCHCADCRTASSTKPRLT